MSLNVTPEAALAIESLISGREGGGLCIFPIPDENNGDQFEMKLAVSEQPEPTDEVVVQHGAKVFVEQQISSFLEDKTLDVSDENGEHRVGFRLVS